MMAQTYRSADCINGVVLDFTKAKEAERNTMRRKKKSQIIINSFSFELILLR
jgi:hypothetical protein